MGLSVWWVSDLPAGTRLAIAVSCLALPAGALAHYALEVLTATGRELLARAIFRVGVPATTLACFGILLTWSWEVGGAKATAEGRVVRGEHGLDVGDPVRVELVHTDVERGFIDFARA